MHYKSLQLHNFESEPLATSKFFHNCHHTSQTPLTGLLVKSMSFKVVLMLSPLPYRDGDIPAPENKGKQPIFIPSLPLTVGFSFTFSSTTCWHTCVFVVFLYSDCTMSLDPHLKGVHPHLLFVTTFVFLSFLYPFPPFSLLTVWSP